MSENTNADEAVEAAVVEPPAAENWEVVGADGRRVDRWLSERDAKARASQLAALTGEKVKAQRQKT